MLQTILTSSRISVQGEFVREFNDGRVMIRVGKSLYVGNPVKKYTPNTQKDKAEEVGIVAC